MLTRRALIGRALTLASAGGTAACAYRSSAPRPSIPAIDTHVHFYDPTRPQGVPWPPASDDLLYRPHLPGDFVPLASATGVAGTVVIEASPWPADNGWLLDLAESYRIVLGVVGSLRPGDEAFGQELRRLTRRTKFKGIRLGAAALRKGVGTRAFETDLHHLADAGLALDVLGGAQMLEDVATLARKVPRLRIVVDHLPFAEWDGDLNAADRALAPLRDLTNVYAKVSGVLRGPEPTSPAALDAYTPRLDLVWEIFGSERVLFASNWPVSTRIASYADTYRAAAGYALGRGLPDAERFLRRNAEAAYDVSI